MESFPHLTIGGDFDRIKSVEYELNIKYDFNIVSVKSVLRRDWNERINKYGCHRDTEYSDEVREAAKAKSLLNG